jgi:hypothetical protein
LSRTDHATLESFAIERPGDAIVRDLASNA